MIGTSGGWTVGQVWEEQGDVQPLQTSGARDVKAPEAVWEAGPEHLSWMQVLSKCLHVAGSERYTCLGQKTKLSLERNFFAGYTFENFRPMVLVL